MPYITGIKRKFHETMEIDSIIQALKNVRQTNGDYRLEELRFLLNSNVREELITMANISKSQPMFIYQRRGAEIGQIIAKCKIQYPDIDDPVRPGLNFCISGCSGDGKSSAGGMIQFKIHDIFKELCIRFLDQHHLRFKRKTLDWYMNGMTQKIIYETISKNDGYGILSYNEADFALKIVGKSIKSETGLEMLLSLTDSVIDPQQYAVASNIPLIANNHASFAGNFVLSGWVKMLAAAEQGVFSRCFAPFVIGKQLSNWQAKYNKKQIDYTLLAKRDELLWRHFNFEMCVDGVIRKRMNPIIFHVEDSEIDEYETKYEEDYGNLDEIIYPETWLTDGCIKHELRTGQDALSMVNRWKDAELKNTASVMLTTLLKRSNRFIMNFAVIHKCMEYQYQVQNINDEINFQNIEIITYEDIAGSAFPMFKLYFYELQQMWQALEFSMSKQLSISDLNNEEKIIREALLYRHEDFKIPFRQFQRRFRRLGSIDVFVKQLQHLENTGIIIIEYTEPNHQQRIDHFIKLPSNEWLHAMQNSIKSIFKKMRVSIADFDATCKFEQYEQNVPDIIQVYDRMNLNNIEQHMNIRQLDDDELLY